VKARIRQQAKGIWRIAPEGASQAPIVIFATEALLDAMDAKVFEQAANVARLPGIVAASFVMPDAHWGYGFPIGGVAAFDPEAGGVISAGGVGFDIACGVRLLITGLPAAEVQAHKEALANALFRRVPAGLGSHGAIRLSNKQMRRMLVDGARWAVAEGWGEEEDLARIEDGGCVEGADPSAVSERAKERMRDEVGTLGSGNHYLEVQEVAEVFDAHIAEGFGLRKGEVVVSIHCGSRGLGHQIGTDYLKEMVQAAPSFGIELPERELACAPIRSSLGRRYLAAMRAGINCALANRQIVAALAQQAFAEVFPGVRLRLLYDVSHNTCKEEFHEVEGKRRRLFVHRKGATRALPPGHPMLPEALRPYGQPVIIGGTMGTGSWVLAGVEENPAFFSACHGAGRAISRHAARKRWHGREIVRELAEQGILVRSVSMRGVAEEAPSAYKDVDEVVRAAELARLAVPVARLRPLICIKG